MASYHVLFSGETVDGADQVQVRTHLARELGIAEHKAKQLFSGRTVVIRSQLSEMDAQQLVSRLADLGAVCRVKDMTPKQPNPARYKLDEQGADKTLRDLTAAHVECPRCGNMQLLATHCSRCGVDIEAAQKQRRKEDAIIEKKIAALRAQQQGAQAEPISADPGDRAGRSLGRWFRRGNA